MRAVTVDDGRLGDLVFATWRFGGEGRILARRLRRVGHDRGRAFAVLLLQKQPSAAARRAGRMLASSVTRCQRHNLLAPGAEERITADKKRIGAPLPQLP